MNHHHHSIGGIPIKYLSLVSLTVQNSLLTILLHYSRTPLKPNEALYSAPAAVLLSEILKSLISFIIAIYNSTSQSLSLSSASASSSQPSTVPSSFQNSIIDHQAFKSEQQTFLPQSTRCSSTSKPVNFSSLIIHQIKFNLAAIFSRDCWKLSIPAILYVIQNNLQFVAASHLDVATFSVTYQLKILTTALCSVIMLHRRLSVTRWISLLFLSIGVGLVQISNDSSSTQPDAKLAHQATKNPAMGFAAVLAACVTSGLAGVYFELVLKSSNKVDLWIRNVQLSLFSLPPALFTAMANSSSSTEPMFAHFGFWAWATVLTQVLGGLVTALVIKFADNILKGFATSLSIILSTLAGVFLFDSRLPFGSALGSSIVLMSTYFYNSSSHDPPSPIASRTDEILGVNTKDQGGPATPSVIIEFTNHLTSSKSDEEDEKDSQDDEMAEDVHLLPQSTAICPSPKSAQFPVFSSRSPRSSIHPDHS